MHKLKCKETLLVKSLAASEIAYYALHTQYVYYRSAYFCVNKQQYAFMHFRRTQRIIMTSLPESLLAG